MKEQKKKKNLKLVKIAFGIQNQWIFLTFKQPSFILFLVEGFIIIKKKKKPTQKGYRMFQTTPLNSSN